MSSVELLNMFFQIETKLSQFSSGLLKVAITSIGSSLVSLSHCCYNNVDFTGSLCVY